MLFRHIAPEASVIVVQTHVLARVNTTIRDARPAAAGKASLLTLYDNRSGQVSVLFDHIDDGIHIFFADLV